MRPKNILKNRHCSKCNLVIEACRKDFVSIGSLYFCYHHLMFLPALGITKTDIETLHDVFNRPADLTEIFNYAFKKIITLNKNDDSTEKSKYLFNTAGKYGIVIDVIKVGFWKNDPNFVPNFVKPTTIQISF